MFETSGKRELRNRKRLTSAQINSTTLSQSGTQPSEAIFIKQNKNKLQQSQTVFGGLKLTESLFDELKKVKALFEGANEDLDRY